MVKFKTNNHKNGKKAKTDSHQRIGSDGDRYEKLASMGKVSVEIINKLYNPVDATNRFLNLALQNIEEDSQSRQFLLESKLGIRKMASLLKRLNKYAKRMEKEMQKIAKDNE